MMGNRIFLIWLIAVAIVGILIDDVDTQSSDTEGAPSNVTVQAAIAISLSANMSDGLFNLTLNQNTDDTADPGMGGSGIINTPNRGNNVTVSTNTPVKLCINQNRNLTLMDDSTKTIPSSNYTWQGTSNSTNVTVSKSTTFLDNPSYTTINSSIDDGGVVYFGFWVDIPITQVAGEYNNTINVKGVRSSASC